MSTESGSSSEFPGAVCAIITSALPTATLNTAYSATIQTVYCVAPLTFSFTGSLPTGLTLDPVLGVISGIPTASGNFNFTVNVVDSTSHSAIFKAALNIASTGGGGGPSIVLPPDQSLVLWNTSSSGTPTNNQTVCVGTPQNASMLPGGSCFGTTYPGTTSGLQSALNAVTCGQIINVASVTGLGSVTLPSNKKCSQTAWIWLTGDLSDPVFPVEGTRADPSLAGIPQWAMPWYPYPLANGSPNTAARHMPQFIASASSNTPPIRLSIPSSGGNIPSIGHWRIQRLQCARDQSADAVTVGCIDLNYQPAASGQDCALTGSGNAALPANPTQCAADQPDHVIISQIVSLSDPQRQTVRAISLGGGTFIAVKDSWIGDILDTYAGGQGDAQAIAGGFGHGYTGVGEWLFQNNFSASSSEGQLFCGAFTEPKSPITNADGIPTSVIWDYPWLYKPEIWDTQRGQTLNQPIVNEGVSYPPANDQEIIFNPAAFTIQSGGPGVALHNTWLNDSAGGWDRFDTNAGSGSITVDGLPCTFTTTTTVGTTSAGTSVVVASAAGFTVGGPILIIAAGSANSNYVGSVTAITGTTLTISPATSVSVGNGTNVLNPVCLPGGNSSNGVIRKNPVHQVGSNPYPMQSIVTYSYIACSGAGTPDIGCTVPTTAGAHSLVFNKIVIDDGRANLANLGHNRTISNTITATVTSAAPTNALFITPSAPDLQIQPSYTDSYNNIRNVSYVLTAGANFTSTSLTWKVDGATNGSTSVGQICSITAIPCTAPGSNDASVVYVSPSVGGLGQHTISVTSAAGTTTSQVITVSKTSPIWGYDMKALTVKNMWEAKCVNRGLLENFLAENSWGSNGNAGGQDNSLLNQAINQASQTTDGSGANVGYGPQNVSDLNVTNGHVLNSGNGLAVAALGQAKGVHRLNYSNLFLENINGPQNGHGFLNPQYTVFLQFSGNSGTNVLSWTSPATPLADNFFASHITMVGGTATIPGVNSWLSIANNNAQFQLGLFSVTNSIFQVPGTVPFTNNNGENNDCNHNNITETEFTTFLGAGYTPPTPCFSSYSLANNLLVDQTSTGKFATSTIWETPDSDPTLFRNFAAGDFRVVAGGPYDVGGARQGTDGLALGAPVDAILANDATIRWGSNSPMTITTTDTLTATSGTAFSLNLAVTGGTAPYVWSLPTGIHPAGAEDILTYAMMPEPDRSHFCMNGPSNPKCFKLDAGLLWWMKGFSGEPWDGEVVGPDYVKQSFTENVWSNSSSYKMYVNAVSLWARYHTPGGDDVVYTPGPNKYVTTINCGADNQPLIDNLGVRGELTGPFTDQLWQTNCIAAGGTSGTCNVPDNTPYLLAQKWIKCTANNISSCTNEEDYWLAKGYGQVQWCPKTWNGSTYVTGTCTNTMQKVAQAAVTPNFTCGVPNPQVTNGLPAGVLRANAPPMTLVDSTGNLNGTPNVPGTYQFTAQVTDAQGRTATKTFTLTVQ